jgi:heat shock protein HslJ
MRLTDACVRPFAVALALAVALAAGGCSSTAGPAAPTPAAAQPLTGTSWELLRFQSMDDAQGTTRIDDPSLYTVTFGDDGTARFRLNCNRGMGPWQASAASDRVSGKLGFGPIAGTRALCPPPSLDQRLVRDLSRVRGYLLRDGQLHMSLEADAGVYSWRPARTP